MQHLSAGAILSPVIITQHHVAVLERVAARFVCNTPVSWESALAEHLSMLYAYITGMQTQCCTLAELVHLLSELTGKLPQTVLEIAIAQLEQITFKNTIH
ncbi:hypothetical protein JYT23_01130 [Mariprofundus ferrooxydans]|nr:hypothetical protein [Mariprofundus ferrooxydans]